MHVLRLKHQKLILQCYPPGKAADKQPNPLELLYLLYYALTRRVKLEKVVEFLKRKTRADVRARRPGNVLVTLRIVLLLIDKCAENLNAFAPQVCLILRAALDVTELPLYRALVATYGVFCAHLDNGLFAGDKLFVALFRDVTWALVARAQDQLACLPTSRREWGVLAVRTCRYAVACLGYSARLAAELVPAAVALWAPVVHAAYSADTLEGRLRASLHVEQASGDRPLARAPTTRTHVPLACQNPDDDALTDADLAEEALRGFQALFHTALAAQIAAATQLVVDHDFARAASIPGTKPLPASPEGTALLQICASFVPVQLRFETLVTLLAALAAAADSAADFTRIRLLATHIRTLLALGFNMIGLSTADVLAQLLTLKTRLCFELADTLAPDQAAELGAIYADCICSLASHVYYADQVADAVEAILLHADSVLRAPTPRHPRRQCALAADALDMIARILAMLAANGSAIAWTRAAVEHWAAGFRLLAFAQSYPELAAALPASDIVAIQGKYLLVVQIFLEAELESATNEERGRAQGYLLPNYKNYIEDKDNALRSLLAHCSDVFDEPYCVPSTARGVARVLGVLARIAGVNFAHNFLPYFAAWQLQRPGTASATARDLTAYYVLTMTLDALGKEYSGLLHEDIGSLELARILCSDIDRRNELWCSSLQNTISSAIFTEQITLATIEHFFSACELKQWLVAPNVLAELDEEHSLAAPKTRGANDIASLGSALSHGGRLGLGSAIDISSIYSGLQHGVDSNGTVEQYTPDTSHVTHVTLVTHRALAQDSRNRRVHVPRVEDLKLAVDGTFNGFLVSNSANGSTAQSLLERQLHMTDVASVLDDLKIDDDREMVV